jgi:uncharacterized protein YukE
MSGFLPPVIFQVQAKATQAIAEFKKVNLELNKMEKEALAAGASINKMSGVLKLTKIAVLGLAGAFGILAAVGVKAAIDEEKALLRLKIAVDNVGQSFAAASPFITQTAESLIELGFADDQTYASLAKLTAATGNVKTAMKSMSVAADLARFKQMSLTEASDLLARASTGQARGLRDLGIAMGVSMDKTASYEEILAAIEERIGGTAKAFGETAAGKLAIFNAKFDELKETLGYAVLPLLIRFVDFLNRKLLPTLSKFFNFLDRNKQILINFGAAFAAIWTFSKIQAGVTLAITAIKGLVAAYNTMKVAGLAAAVAQRMALNPLLGAAAGALLLGALAKTISDAKKTNEEVKELKLNLDDIGDGAKYPTSEMGKFADKLVEVTQRIKDFNIEIKDTFTELQTSWTGVVGKDFNAAISEGLLNPIDKLVTKSQTAVKAYQDASSKYQSALTSLKSAQNNYTNAVKSGNKTLIASTESALKRAEELVKNLQSSMGGALKDIASLQQEMIDAVIESEKKLSELRLERQKVLDDAFKEELQLQKDYNSKVLQLQKDAAKRSAEIVKQSVDQLRNIFKGSTYRGIGDIFSGLTFEGKYLQGGSIQAITSALAKQTEKATSLADKAGKLQALGFTQTFIEEVVAQGPDVGGALADTIISSNPESIKQLQAYWLALEKISAHGVDSIATKLNSGLTLATEELTQQLADVQTELTLALSDAFKEYSDALTEIRTKTAEQIKVIDDQITQLIARIAQLKAALESLAMLNAPGTTPTSTTGFERLGTDIGSMSPKLMEAVVSGANSYKVAEDTRLQALASGMNKVDATTTARLTGQAIAYYQSQLAQAKAQGVTVNIVANTNASPEQIAKDTAWAIRTSSDVQYNVSSSQIVAERKAKQGYL